MALTAGTRLGPYEIVSPLGAGGMGEVYRARDTRLERTVAIKVLPEHFATDPKLRERFEREARAISSLKHPNICTLYDVGHQDSTEYLVLEYLEGESLAERLERGPLPMEQVLAYGIQIAEALERAHRQGVVHRDLKPGNVMVTKDGVKLLDFGLAKPMAGAGLASSALGAMTASHQQQKPLTAEGAIVGTFQYMAPEQLEGKDADPRSDLFAFGCVLYEMTAGKRPFAGKTQASLVASILATEPPAISSVQPLTPPAFERVVKTCLAKDPDERWQTAHDVKLQLKWIAEGGSQAGVAAPVAAHRKHREWTAWGVAGVFLLLALGGAAAYWRLASAPQRVIRSAVLTPDKVQLSLMGRNGAPAISPDGAMIAFVAAKGGQRSLWLRELSAADAKPLPGTEGAYAPFWSPDGRHLAFFAEGKLKKMGIDGGPPENICDADDARGGSWGNKDVILFAPTRFSAIFKVPAAGGTPVQAIDLTKDLSQRWPSFLPDGEHFLFVQSPTGTATGSNTLRMGSLGNRSSKIVAPTAYSAEYALGQLFFVSDGVLKAQSFDPERGELSGEPVIIAPGVQADRLFSHALFSVSPAGELVYEPGTISDEAQLIWYDHKGKQLGVLGEPKVYNELSISPDESKVAVQEFPPNVDLWIFDLTRNIHSRFTTTGSNHRFPVWSPDGSQIAYASSLQTPQLSLVVQPANGGKAPELLYGPQTFDLIPTDWSHDGRYITFTQNSATTKLDIWMLPMNGDRKPFPFMQTPFDEAGAKFSPDGHWVAYDSDESGRDEIYVAPFPAGGQKWQVSNAGGTQPVWSKSGTELYYLALDNTIMSASLAVAGNSPRIGAPNALFAAHPRNILVGVYDVTRDGRFLVSSAPDESNAPLTLISNWPTLVKK